MNNPGSIRQTTFRDPISQPLSRASEELEAIKAELDCLEDSICEIIDTAGITGSHIISNLQSLDHIKQKIDGLSVFIRLLAEVCPKSWAVDSRQASQALRLSELALRLNGDAACDESIHKTNEEIFHLFDDKT